MADIVLQCESVFDIQNSRPVPTKHLIVLMPRQNCVKITPFNFILT